MAMSALPAFAQEKLTIDKNAPGNLEDITIQSLLSGLVKTLVVVAAIVFFFMLVLGGIKWIMSGGDKGKTEEARNQITAALVGLVIVFAAWAIAQLIATLFGVNVFDLELPKFTK